MKRICEHCRQEYDTPPSQRPRYCSARCVGLAKRRGREITCAICGKRVWCPPSHIREYCSKSCARTALNRTNANPAHHRDIRGEKNPMHGRSLKGKANGMHGRQKERCPRWSGGRRVMDNLYVRVVAPDDHPHPCDQTSASKYVLEHRLMMERHLGRHLTPKEVVHHENGCPYDNRIENLRLFPDRAAHNRFHAADDPEYGGRGKKCPGKGRRKRKT